MRRGKCRAVRKGTEVEREEERLRAGVCVCEREGGIYREMREREGEKRERKK